MRATLALVAGLMIPLSAGAAELPGGQFNGDSVFAWNEGDGRIDYYIWGSDGNHGQHEAYYAGEELVFPVRSKQDPDQVAFRSVWRRIDDATIEVRREVPDATDWKTELTIVYRRAPLAQ